jgi:probable HAF family extracellular repeat protein
VVRKGRLPALVLVTATALLALAPVARAASFFIARDLGTLGGSTSRAVEINDQGQVAGSSETAGGRTHAFLWTSSGGMIDLGTPGTPDSIATAINELGQVVGRTGGDAFSWTAEAGMVDLGTLGGSVSAANAVNDQGGVVGYAAAADGRWHAFLWRAADGLIDIGPPLRTSVAEDINNLGEAVGSFSIETGQTILFRAFFWSANTGPVPFGTFGGNDSAAIAINDQSQVAGYSDTASGVSHGFLWTPSGGMVDIGTLGGYSRPEAISETGQIVGFSATSGSAHAFAWTANGGMVDLGTLGGIESEARAVNEHGQVVGLSVTPSGSVHGFSWTANGGMVDLPPLAGDLSFAEAVNNRGEVVGVSSTADPGDVHAVLWEPATKESCKGDGWRQLGFRNQGQCIAAVNRPG